MYCVNPSVKEELNRIGEITAASSIVGTGVDHFVRKMVLKQTSMLFLIRS
jgi:hypothetical protein